MADRHDGGAAAAAAGGGKGGKILHMTVKRARRVQEKMMQRLGKSDQTRDEVFEEFVNNFHKQNAYAVKLQKEMMKYMNSIRVLYQNTKAMSETLKELYEEDWEGCDKQRELMEQRVLLWEDLLTSLSSRTVEPMANYLSRFADVKARIQKRERKVVDYDLRRRELEQLKSKQKVNDQKVQQAGESHTQAKQFYDEITDDLYEELPTLYDSRIQFYAQIFQSIAASEAKFHAEISKIDEDLARVMDGLAAEAATGVHSTKKQRNVLASTPKLLSRPAEGDSEEDSEGADSNPVSRSPSLNQSQFSPTPASEPTENSVTSDQEQPLSSDKPGEVPSDQPEKPPPFKPADGSISSAPEDNSPPPEGKEEEKQGEVEEGPGEGPGEGPEEPSKEGKEEAETSAVAEESPTEQERVASPLKSPPPKPAPLDVPPPSGNPSTTAETVERGSGKVDPPDNLLFTVVATHLYQGDDEDELSFEKGAVIYIVPYEDPEDEEEGWCMGVLQKNGDKGIFPENFTKGQD